MSNVTVTSLSYQIDVSRYGKIVCYPQEFLFEKSNQTGWETGSTLASALPYFITQIFVANLSYRLLYYLTRPLFLPPLVAQILSGLIFSPSLLGNSRFVVQYIFPYRFTMVFETFAYLALLFNVFLLGCGTDLRSLRLAEPKPLIISLSGLVVALPLAIFLYYLPGNGSSDKILSGCVFWSVAMVCTNFPDLAMVLADLKLLRSDVGKLAMSAAIVTDVSTWVLMVLGFAAFTETGSWNKMMPFVLLSTAGFFVFCWFIIRPAISWGFSKTVKSGNGGDTHVCFILCGVIFCSLVTDACGAHSITGAFLFGLSIPHDHSVRSMIEEKLHDFLTGILMPLFYIVCGLRADLYYMLEFTDPVILALVITASFMAKILTTFVVSLSMHMSVRDSMALGCLMNTKGTFALVVLNAGRDIKALDSPMFTHMILVFLVMSLLLEPLLALTYKPKKKLVYYKNRMIQKLRGDAEFRVLACVHAFSNVLGITSLLQSSNLTKQSPLYLFAVHLVELTGRTTTSMLIINDDSKSKVNFSDRVRAESHQIAGAFEAMEVHNDSVMVQTITAVSPYSTMHEDICAVAEDKRVCFILLPYHMHLTPDGRMTEGNVTHGDINLNVLNNAPCSVGILVDRGLSLVRSESLRHSGMLTKRQVAMIFVGGPDDREALSYAWRMVAQRTIMLTVVRFIPSHQALVSAGKSAASYEKEKQIDDECIYEFNFNTVNDPSVIYIEKVVNDGQDTISAVREMEVEYSYDLYIVGRGYDSNSPVTADLVDWNNIPELGTIGDTLASSNFSIHASVLVIQQYSAENRQAKAVAGFGDDGNNQEPATISRAVEPSKASMHDERRAEEEEYYQFSIHK